MLYVLYSCNLKKIGRVIMKRVINITTIASWNCSRQVQAGRFQYSAINSSRSLLFQNIVVKIDNK